MSLWVIALDVDAKYPVKCSGFTVPRLPKKTVEQMSPAVEMEQAVTGAKRLTARKFVLEVGKATAVASGASAEQAGAADSAPTGALILLHGRGGSEHDLEPFAHEFLRTSQLDSADQGEPRRWEVHSLRATNPFGADAQTLAMFRAAGVQVPEENNAFQWFEGASSAPGPDAPEQIDEALRAVLEYVRGEVLSQPKSETSASASVDRIAFLGYSQGATLLWSIAAQDEFRSHLQEILSAAGLRGVRVPMACISGRLQPFIVSAEQERRAQEQKSKTGEDATTTSGIEIFAAHGKRDEVTSFEMGEQSWKSMRELARGTIPLDTLVHDGGHSQLEALYTSDIRQRLEKFFFGGRQGRSEL